MSKLVHLSIAQQNLLSGDVLIPVIARILEHGPTHVDFNLAIKALKSNTYISHNVVMYMLKDKIDFHPESNEMYNSYTELYERNDHCQWDEKKKTYLNCGHKVLTDLSLPLVFKKGKVVLPDGKTEVAMIAPQDLREGKLIYTPFLSRSIALKDQLTLKMMNFNNVLDMALMENLYSW